MDFQFIIPHKNSELLNTNGNNYFVKKVYDASDLSELFKEARNAAADPFHIFDHFDTYFSFIENVENVQRQLFVRASDQIYDTTDKLGRILTAFFQQTNMTERDSHLNLTKMVLFLNIGFARALDVLMNDGQTDGLQKKSTKKAMGCNDNDLYKFDERKYKILVQVHNVMQLPLEKLWSLCIAEEDFVNMICDMGYRSLENPMIKEKKVADTVFQIFGTAIKRYNHALTFPVRILQILRTCEVAVSPSAHGVYLLAEEFGITTIFSTLLKDLVDTLSVDAADSSTSRYFGQFLSELGTIAPKLLMPHLATLRDELLNLDSYVLRNCVLQIMGDVVTVELATEDLTDELKDIRDEFLEDLLNHLMDVSSYVRSKVLQIWNHMKAESSVPLVWQNKVLRMAAERLDDRATYVRKNAVLLIKTFLEMNPFAAKLSLQELKDKHELEIAKLVVIRGKRDELRKITKEREELWTVIVPQIMICIENKLANPTQDDNVETAAAPVPEKLINEISEFLLDKKYEEAFILVRKVDQINEKETAILSQADKCAYYSVLLHSYFLAVTDHDEELQTLEQTTKFLADSIEFSDIIAESVPKIENMLLSKNNTDVVEAVDFFTTAYLFGIKDTTSGMRKMLSLVWSSDKEKREAVTKAYIRVLFGTDESGRPHALKVVDNLCNFFEHITIGQYAAVEVLMQEWIENEDINNQIIHVMFERFTQKLENTSNNMARLALQLLIMASATKPSITTANSDLIQAICFGERGMKDPWLFASCLRLLMNLVQKNTKFYKRIDRSNAMIESTVDMFTKFFFFPNIHDFDNVVINTFDFIYRLCQAPDELCQQMLFDLCKKIQEINEALKIQQKNGESEDNSNSLVLPTYILRRIIFLIGYIAMKEMVFLDIDVYNNMKYRQELMEENKSEKRKDKKRKTVANMNMSASNAIKRKSGSNTEPQQDPDEMLDGASAEDSIAELINGICESELMYSVTGICPRFTPIIMEILQSPGRFRDEELQQAACLTLIRFMTVSSKFCETNMPFLMNILNQTKNIKMKCNIIVGLSDFTFRFPNVIQSWTANIYATLHDKNDQIRLTAVKMLSHMILHEMIRVKGQISDLALCIVDNNEEIRNSTQEFFKEIAQKSNILYNVLPDIISRLSGSHMQLEEEKYHVIMKYIMGLIQKDRQVESLVEKLVLRFRVTNEERQWRDIAYCLSLLSYTEKTIRKLIDNVQDFKDKIQIEEVHECFKTIIANTSKMAKPELKAAVTDLAARIEDCLVVREVDDTAEESVRRSINDMPPPKRIPKRGKKVPVKGKTQQRRRVRDSDSDSDEDMPTRRGQPAASVRSSARKPQKKSKLINDDSETSSSSDDEGSKSKPRKK